MPDARVQAAIDNWAPRFVANGVDANDFERTTGAIERWDEWLDAWSAKGDLHAGLAREAEEAGHGLTAGEAYVRAALAYHFAKFVWMLDEGKHRRATEQAIESLYAAHRHLDPTAERIEAPLAGGSIVANLRLPARDGSVPLAVLIPGLDSTKEEFYHWENVFLARGLATLSLDGPGQGESGFTSTIRPDYEVAVGAILDALSGRPGLELDRVGAAGVSLGGYYAPRAAAFEPRIRAVAAVGGPYDFGDCWPRLPSLTRETFAHHAGARDEDEARAKAGELNLVGVLERVQQPLLVVFGKLDRLIPWQHAERVAAEAPNAELALHEDGNHVCNNVPYRWRPQLADWMKERLAHVG